MRISQGTLTILSVISLFKLLNLINAQDFTLVHQVNIPNCNESYLDNQGVERCQICQAGFTKSYDMTVCKLATMRGCIWESKWGCLECQCGQVVKYDLKNCVDQIIEGCLRLDQKGTGCIQPKIGYTIVYTEPSSVFTYSSIKADQGEYCGWQKSGDSGCTKCQVGFYLETGGKSCKKLNKRLQNEHSFWLASNDMTTPATTIKIIPGWESVMNAFTNAGAFESVITDCLQYDDVLNRYDNNALCTQCDKGKVKTQNQKQCVDGPNLCDYADNDLHYCIKCKDPLNYWADSISKKCLIRDQMFDDCIDRDLVKDECKKCSLSGFKLDPSKKCIYIDNCKVSDGLVNCTQCNEQFYKDNTSGSTTCSPLPLNCAQVTAGVCSQCQDNYYLWTFNNTCYLKAPNCDTVDQTSALQANHKCSACKTGYHLVDNYCYQDIPKCITHFTTGKDGCQTCETMYTPSVDASECLLHNLQFQKYCRQTDGQGKCLQCISLKFIPQCLDITNANLCLISDGINNKCIQCLPNAILNNNICQAIDSTCIRTDGMTKCKQCQMGYYIDLTTFKCLPISACKVSDGVSSNCLACFDGYILNNNQCDSKTPGCAIEIYNGTVKQCIQCLSGYANNSGTCTLIKNCLISDGISNKCYQCNTDKQYRQDQTDPQKQCVDFDPDPTIKPPQFCNVFYTNFINLKDSVCTTKNLSPKYGYCLSCQSPRVLRLRIDGTDCTTSTAVFQECVELSQIGTLIDNCRVYDFTPGKCRICENNYTPDVNGICVFQPSISYCQNTIDPFNFQNLSNCQVCMDGVYLTNNTCKTTVQNCKSYTSAGCTSCQNNFYFDSAANLCTSYAGQQCATWSDAAKTTCATCNSGFEYIESTNPNICLYNPYSTSCANVVVRDPINNKYCLSLTTNQPDINCLEYDASGICSKCKSGFLLQKSINNKIYLECVNKASTQCTTVDSNGQYCQTCAATYYLNLTQDGGVCLQINNCIQPTNQGDGTGCTQCNTAGYYIDQNGFNCSQLANCLLTDGVNPFCLQCNSLYYPGVGGVCVELAMLGCTSSTGTGPQCTQCSDLYYLDTNKSCKLGKVNNCLKYDPILGPTNPDKCALCKPGYKLNASFKCDELLNCLVSDGTSTAVCTKCKDYFYLKTATNGCLEPDIPIDYCRIYADNTQACVECDIPFYLDVQTCKSRSNKNDYCKAYSYTDKICLQCQTKTIGGVIVQDDQSIKKGFCNPIQIDKCDTYQQNQPKCQICNQVSDQEVGWLVPSKNYCKDVDSMKCLTMNPLGTKCASCQQGVNAYFKSKGQCYPLCVNGYLIANANPALDPVCQTYTAANVANCEQTDPVNDACLVCSKSYVFNKTTKVCDKMTVANCADNGTERGQTCYECEPHYILSNNKCTAAAAIANCATYVKNTGQCGLCANGYYLTTEGKSCIAITSKNCKVNSIDSDACLICTDNTYTISADGKSCFTGRATSHCIISSTIASNSQCSVCEAGYIPVSGQQTCILDTFYLPGCTSVKQLSGKSYYTCASCKASYNLQNNICIPSQGLSTCSVANCSEYSSYLYDSASCKACVTIQDSTDSYQLQNNNCVFVQAGSHLSFIIALFIGFIFLIL